VAKPVRLTRRQEDALWCFGDQGMNARETADMMLITKATAQGYANQLRRIFGVEATRHLVPHARRYFDRARRPD